MPKSGPVIGGFVQENKGWRWLEWVSVFLAVLTYLWALGMCETYKKAILKKLKKAQLDSKHDRSAEHIQVTHIFDALKTWVSAYLGRPLAMLVTEPVVLFLCLYVALNFGILYNFFPAVPWSLSRTYGFNEGQSGLAFIAIAIGCVLATTTAVVFDLTLRRRRHVNGASQAYVPEQCLWPAMVGSLGGPTGLFWFAWSTRQDVHWASPVCALIPFAWGNLCIFVRDPPLTLREHILTPFSRSLLSVTWSTSTDRHSVRQQVPRMHSRGTDSPPPFLSLPCKVSALTSDSCEAAGWLTQDYPVYENLGTGVATSILGACSAAMVPIPWVLYRWGPYIRSRSRRAVSLSV
jgi:MFS family permease